MKKELKNFIIVIIAICAFGIINLLPIAGLEPLGKMHLGIITCMLILWFTEAVPSPVTFFIQIGLVTLVMPIISDMKSAEIFRVAMTSLASNTIALFICAFFIVSAVEKSGLARRIALAILNIVGPKPKKFLMGILFAGGFLNIFLPAAMSVSALLTGIVAGIVADYNIDKNSNFSKSLYLAVGVGTIAGNIFIQTAGAPAVAITGLISNNFNYDITYFEFMKFGLPLGILMDIFAYFLITRLFPSEYEILPGGGDYIRNKLKELGKWNNKEIKTGIVLALTVILWMTGGKFHDISSQTVAMISCAVLMCPYVGVYTFKEMSSTVPWGTIIFMGSSMSLASGMVTYGTAAWLVDNLINMTNLTSAPFIIILIGTLIIMAICSMAFSVRASAVNSIIPCVILLAAAIANNLGASFNPMGFTMVMFYPLLFAIILPVHSPYTLFPQAAGGYESKDLVKVTVPYVFLTIISCVILYFTYWKFVGLT